MHEVLVNRLAGLSLPRKSVVRLTDRLDMTLDVNRGRKTTMQQQQQQQFYLLYEPCCVLYIFVNGKDTNQSVQSSQSLQFVPVPYFFGYRISLVFRWGFSLPK